VTKVAPVEAIVLLVRWRAFAPVVDLCSLDALAPFVPSTKSTRRRELGFR
jgi:hypothetical protein